MLTKNLVKMPRTPQMPVQHRRKDKFLPGTWLTCVAILCLAGRAIGATTFVQNFDGITSSVGTTLVNTTTELAATYAAGNAALGGFGAPNDPYWTVENGKWGKGVSSVNPNAIKAMLYDRASNLANTQGTIELWWKPDAAELYQGANTYFFTSLDASTWGAGWKDYTNGDARGTFSFLWSTDQKKLLFAYRDNAGVLTYTVGPSASDWFPTATEWHHIAVTYSATGFQVFADGQGGDFSSSATWSTSNMQAWFTIGADPVKSSFYGTLDSLRLSDAVLYSGSSYTVPTSQFAVPEPVSMVILLGGLMMALRRSNRIPLNAGS